MPSRWRPRFAIILSLTAGFAWLAPPAVAQPPPADLSITKTDGVTIVERDGHAVEHRHGQPWVPGRPELGQQLRHRH
jgi:hypothetical protein